MPWPQVRLVIAALLLAALGLSSGAVASSQKVPSSCGDIAQETKSWGQWLYDGIGEVEPYLLKHEFGHIWLELQLAAVKQRLRPIKEGLLPVKQRAEAYRLLRAISGLGWSLGRLWSVATTISARGRSPVQWVFEGGAWTLGYVFAGPLSLAYEGPTARIFRQIATGEIKDLSWQDRMWLRAQPRTWSGSSRQFYDAERSEFPIEALAIRTLEYLRKNPSAATLVGAYEDIHRGTFFLFEMILVLGMLQAMSLEVEDLEEYMRPGTVKLEEDVIQYIVESDLTPAGGLRMPYNHASLRIGQTFYNASHDRLESFVPSKYWGIESLRLGAQRDEARREGKSEAEIEAATQGTRDELRRQADGLSRPVYHVVTLRLGKERVQAIRQGLERRKFQTYDNEVGRVTCSTIALDSAGLDCALYDASPSLAMYLLLSDRKKHGVVDVRLATRNPSTWIKARHLLQTAADARLHFLSLMVASPLTISSAFWDRKRLRQEHGGEITYSDAYTESARQAQKDRVESPPEFQGGYWRYMREMNLVRAGMDLIRQFREGGQAPDGDVVREVKEVMAALGKSLERDLESPYLTFEEYWQLHYAREFLKHLQAELEKGR